jgi:hypothetical protein
MQTQLQEPQEQYRPEWDAEDEAALAGYGKPVEEESAAEDKAEGAEE